MSSSPYNSKTYSFIELNTVNFTESQVKNIKIFKNLLIIHFFSPAPSSRLSAQTRLPSVGQGPLRKLFPDFLRRKNQENNQPLSGLFSQK
jgi:hypothetical protein